MGLIASQMRIMYLKAYKFDLEYKMQICTQTKLGLSSANSDLMSIGTDMDPDSEAVKKLEQRKERLNAMEKKIDMQMALYESRLKMIETELQSCQELLDKNISSSFSYGGGR